MAKDKKAKKCAKDYLDCTVNLCREKIADCGEDSFVYAVNDNAFMNAVFDGCGGSGARKYDRFKGKTGAYMASRVTAGAAKDWFGECCAVPGLPFSPDTLKSKICEYLSLCKTVGGRTSGIKGSLSKDFPTTAAMTVTKLEGGVLVADCIWAGDSRCYMLNEDGLFQLTADDIGGQDAMENLTVDSVLTNVITTSHDFELRARRITIEKPCILFAATDGCFGYLSTPMEFEYLLEETLLKAQCMDGWQNRICEELEKFAGDDFTLSASVIGFGSYETLVKKLSPRASQMLATYINGIDDMTLEEKTAMWQEYKKEYSVYIEGR